MGKAPTQMLADTMLMPLNAARDISDKFNAPNSDKEEEHDLRTKSEWMRNAVDADAEARQKRKMDHMVAHIKRTAKPEDAGAWWQGWWEHPRADSVVYAVSKDLGMVGGDAAKD